MATIRDLGRRALAMLRVQGRGALKADDGEIVLDVAGSFFLSLPGTLISGTLTNVRILNDYVAGEDERIFNAEDDNAAITLPESIFDPQNPESDDTGYRPPRNGAVVQIVGPAPRTFVYVAYAGEWRELSNITLNSQNPLGPEHDEDVAAQLAVRLAPYFLPGDPPSIVISLADRGRQSIRLRFRKTGLKVAVDAALLNLTGASRYGVDPSTI